MSDDELRRIIIDVGRHHADRSIATTRAELRVRLSDAGIAVPSESWLDALAREAVHGRAYVLDTSDSSTDERDDPALAQALEEAPATLAVEPSIGRSTEPLRDGPAGPAPAATDTDTGEAPVEKGPLGGPGSSGRRPLILLGAIAVALLLWRLRRRRATRTVQREV